MKKILVNILLAFLVIALVSSCSAEQDVPYGSLKIDISSAISKGIDSNISLDAEYYMIEGTGPNGSTFSVRIESAEGSYTQEKVAVGSWTIAATAYNADNIAIGSGSTSANVNPKGVSSVSIVIKEIQGQGTLNVVIEGGVLDDTYTLHLYAIENGAYSPILDQAFTKTDGVLSIELELDNGFYAFDITAGNSTTPLLPIETLRIIKDDTITVTYTLNSEGKLSVSVKNEIFKTPSISITKSADYIRPDGNIRATAVVSNIETTNLSYSWYLDNINLDRHESSIELSYDEAGEGTHTLTCLITDVTTGLVWSENEEFECSSSTAPSYSCLTITENGSVSCTDKTITEVVIPKYIDDIKVTSIGKNAFDGCKSLTSITIPDSVTSIGDYAFRQCSSLESITIPDSVESIGKGAFRECDSFTEIVIPDSVTSIGYGAFTWCNSLTEITLPNSITEIGRSFFENCALTSITIPNSVTTIGSCAFQGNEFTEIIIPDSVTSIGDYAFNFCSSLESVSIGNSVTFIEDYAFQGCSSLESITIPDSVTTIGEHAFEDCKSLASIYIENKEGSIEFGSNWNPNNAIVYWKYPILDITEDGIVSCIDSSITEVTIPRDINGIKVLGIESDAFSNCNDLKTIYIFAEENSIEGAPWGASSATVYWRNPYLSITEDGVVSCINSSATEIVIPEYVNGIKVTSIGEEAFYSCSSLESVTIPVGVTSIGDYAFQNCKSLSSINIPNGVTSIGTDAFRSCSALTSINIPNSVTLIDWGAFFACSSLTEITIPDSITYIDECVFRACSSLASVTIPDSVTSIGEEAFMYCRSLTEITIPESVTFIGPHAFAGCPVVNDVNLPDEQKVFVCLGNCKTSVAIPENFTSIGEHAFYSCITEPTEIIIPNSITSIERYAFWWATELTEITIPDSVTSIGSGAFSTCDSLESIYIDKEKDSISGAPWSAPSATVYWKGEF